MCNKHAHMCVHRHIKQLSWWGSRHISTFSARLVTSCPPSRPPVEQIFLSQERLTEAHRGKKQLKTHSHYSAQWMPYFPDELHLCLVYGSEPISHSTCAREAIDWETGKTKIQQGSLGSEFGYEMLMFNTCWSFCSCYLTLKPHVQCLWVL